MTNQAPSTRKGKQRSSIWEINETKESYESVVSRAIYTPLRAVGVDGWTHWPMQPNFVKNVRVLACEDTWQAEIELYARMYAQFAWTTFVPSPVEVTRKLLLGGYKCGFYLPVKFKSPLNFFIGEGGTKYLAELAGPFTRALWWWWVIGSAWNALTTYQTIQDYKKDCDYNYNCSIGNASANFGTASGGGTPAGYDVISDELFHYVAPVSISYLAGSVYATAYVECNVFVAATINDLRIRIRRGVTVLAEQQMGPIPGIGVYHSNVSIDFQAASAGQLFVDFQWSGLSGGIAVVASMGVSRFTVVGDPS